MKTDINQMPNDINDMVFMYTTKEMAEKVGIASPTVRKYAQILEKRGYEFTKNGDRRLFINKDIKTMLKMKESDNIEKTAYALAQEQKKESDMKNDIEKAIQSISLSDTLPSTKEKSEEIAFLDNRYNQLLSAFSSMAAEYAMTREKVDAIEENTEKIVSTLDEIMNQLKEEKGEKELYKEKLDIAVNYIQKQEETQKQEEPAKQEKKGILKRLFGG